MICNFHVESAVCKLRNLLPRLGRKFETLTCFFQYNVCYAFVIYFHHHHHHQQQQQQQQFV